MRTLCQVVLYTMIPGNLILLLWIWGGRMLLGSGGWMLLVMLMVVPFVGLALLLTTILGFVRSGSPKSLTRSQAVSQLVVWAGLFGVGLFLVDFGDTEGSVTSGFGQLVGSNSDGVITLSSVLMTVSAVVAILAWVTLLVLLLAQRRTPPVEAYAAPRPAVAAPPGGMPPRP